MKVSVQELRRALSRVLDHVEETGHDEVEVDADFYWSVPDDQIYRPYDEPSGLTLGQLSDDIERLRSLAAGADDAIAYDLVWLAAVLRFIGARVVS